MSQQKVDRYKEEKANRRDNLKKQKKKKLWTKIGLWVLAIAIVGGLAGAIGYTGYNKYKTYEASKPDYTSDSMVLTDLAGVLETESESEKASEETKETESEIQKEATTQAE